MTTMMMPRTFPTFAMLVLAFAFTGCNNSSGKAQSGLRQVDMKIGSKTLRLEVADTPDSRQTGLMRRDSMPGDHGMLFVFATEETLGFYMKNTRIPLDIIFVDASGRVVSIHTMKPYDLTTTRSAGPAKYAIELNAGVAADTGVKPGDTLAIPADAKDTKE